MGLDDHMRRKIQSEFQHPLVHTLADFSYVSPALGGEATTLEATLDWILAVLYPLAQAAVADQASLPSGGACTITIANPGVVTLNSHGYSDNDQVYLTTTGSLPTGLAVDTVYYVVNSDTNTLQLSETKDGAAIETTGSQSGTHTLNNVNLAYRVVSDDGDGKAASYRWEKREGDAVFSWYKIYDMDWGETTILSNFLIKTQDVYTYKHGIDDLDSSGVALTGVNAGQHLYGGQSANTHLTLHANSGDGTGAQTGRVQVADNFAPQVDSTWSSGTTSLRWLKVWTDEITSSTMTILGGSITDTSGAISFGDENLSTTGWVRTDGGLRDNQVTTPINIGDASNTAFSTNTIDSGSSFVGAINQLQLSMQSLTSSGRFSWDAGATYYTITGGALRLDLGGVGYIKSKKVTWTAPQTTGVFAANTLNFVYIDSAGAIQSTTTRNDALFQDNIPLFEVLYDGTNYVVVREDHPYNFDTQVSLYSHDVIGPVLHGTGAIATVVSATGGGAAGDREIKIVGADEIDDHGLHTVIPDSGGAGVTWNVYYTNAGGNWVRYAQQTQIPEYYNNAGTPTQLNTGPLNDVTVYVLYVSKDDLNSSTPTYFAVMDDAVYNTEAGALAAIEAGTVAVATGELAGIELAQLGFAIVSRINATDWEITDIIVSRAVLGNTSLSGSVNSAALVSTITTNFNGWLSASDTSVQLALDTLDDLAFQLDVDNLRLDGNTLSSTNTDGNVIVDPNGAGLVELGAAVFPTTTSAWDIGKSGSVWNKLWIDGSIGDGVNEITMATLLSLRSVLTGPPSTGDALFYNAGTGLWVPSAPDTEIDHGTLSGLADDDHTQYLLLAGRAGGQVVYGGTASGNDLTLESTSDGTKGKIFFSSVPAPTTDASYAAGWNGTDIGQSANNFRDVYTKGVFVGFRLQNDVAANIPGASAQNTGRLWYANDTKKVYADTGGTWQKISPTLWNSDEAFDGSQTSKNIDVSATITDAQTAIWQLRDNANSYEVMPVDITTPAAGTVTVSCNPPLPSGSYRLLGIEV